jgi:ATP-binding cassette subfamily B multidrug efflux pump
MKIPRAGRIRDTASPIQPRVVGLRDKIEATRDPRHALRRLLPYLLPFKGMLIAVCGLIVIYTVLGLIGPYLMGVAIDRFIAVKELSGLAMISVWMLIVYLLNNLFQAVSAWLMADVSQRALKALRRDLFSHMQTLPVRFFDGKPAGELMSRLTNDIDAVNQAVSQASSPWRGSWARCSFWIGGWRSPPCSSFQLCSRSPNSLPGTRGADFGIFRGSSASSTP